MKVTVASVLFEYTGGRHEVVGEGETLGDLLADLDRRFPGMSFRIVDEQGRLRPHMNLFVSGRPTRDLRKRIAAGDEIHILQALSGG